MWIPRVLFLGSPRNSVAVVSSLCIRSKDLQSLQGAGPNFVSQPCRTTSQCWVLAKWEGETLRPGGRNPSLLSYKHSVVFPLLSAGGHHEAAWSQEPGSGRALLCRRCKVCVTVSPWAGEMKQVNILWIIVSFLKYWYSGRCYWNSCFLYILSWNFVHYLHFELLSFFFLLQHNRKCSCLYLGKPPETSSYRSSL